jgi:hypothetical protein
MFAIEKRTKHQRLFFVNGVVTLSGFKRSLMLWCLGVHVIALVLAGGHQTLFFHPFSPDETAVAPIEEQYAQ